MIPRTHAGCALPKKLGFSALINRRCPPSFSANAISVSRVQPYSFGSISGKTYESRNFVVRAEAGSEEATEAPEEQEAADTVAEGTDGELESEPEAPRKPVVKLGDIMGILHKRAIEATDEIRPIPDIRVGDVVEIKLEVPENRRRLSVYKGIVMSRQNAGVHTTIRIRRIIAGIGVEIVFPLYSPNIKEIRVVSHRKVRRAKLYYLREKLPRLSTFK